MTETVNVIRLLIPGPPVGKGRPRFNGQTGRTYTPAATVHAERDVRAVWREAGSLRLPDGPVVAHIYVHLERPASHWTSRGELSAVGRRTEYPCRKPDLDNQIKLFLDSLNGLAYHDDAQVVEVHARRLWLPARGTGSHTILTLLTKTLVALPDELAVGRAA